MPASASGSIPAASQVLENFGQKLERRASAAHKRKDTALDAGTTAAPQLAANIYDSCKPPQEWRKLSSLRGLCFAPIKSQYCLSD